jgi:hypothetical protein
MPHACPQGYNSHFIEKLLDVSYDARAGSYCERVYPTCATCQSCRSLDPQSRKMTGVARFQRVGRGYHQQ